jgi:hypothetical protein
MFSRLAAGRRAMMKRHHCYWYPLTPAERHGAASRVPHGRGGARRRAPPPRPRVARARPRVHHRGVRRRLRPPGPPQLAHVRCAPRVVGGHRRPPPLLFHTTTRASR